MSLTRLKNAILEKARLHENGGIVDPSDNGYSDGDRYGIVRSTVARRNARILSAIEELEAEGKIEPYLNYTFLWKIKE